MSTPARECASACPADSPSAEQAPSDSTRAKGASEARVLVVVPTGTERAGEWGRIIERHRRNWLSGDIQHSHVTWMCPEIGGPPFYNHPKTYTCEDNQITAFFVGENVFLAQTVPCKL